MLPINRRLYFSNALAHIIIIIIIIFKFTS